MATWAPRSSSSAKQFRPWPWSSASLGPLPFPLQAEPLLPQPSTHHPWTHVTDCPGTGVVSPERPPAPVALHTVSPGTGLAHSSTQGFWERTEGGSLGGAGDSTALAGGEVWKGEKWPLATWAPLGCSCPKSSVAGALVTQHPLSSLACPPGAGERAGGLARGVGSKPGGPPASSAGPSSPGGPREALGHLSHPCSSDAREICSFLSGGKCRPHYAVSCEPVTVVSRLQGGAGCLFSEAKFNCFYKILGSLCAWLLLTVLFREETAALWCPRWTRRVSTGPTRPSAPQLPAQLLALAFGNPCAGSGLGAPAGGALPSELLGGKAGATPPDSHRSGAAQPSSLQTQAPACHLWRDLVRIGVGVRLGLGRLKGWLGCPVGSQRGGQEPGSLGRSWREGGDGGGAATVLEDGPATCDLQSGVLWGRRRCSSPRGQRALPGGNSLVPPRSWLCL